MTVVLQAVQHAVELARQIGHLDRHRLNRHALAELMPGHGNRLGLHCSQRRQALVCRQPAQNTAHGNGDQGVPEQGAAQLNQKVSWCSGTLGGHEPHRGPMLGGMVTAPLLSLFVIPAAYVLMRKPRKRGRLNTEAS